LVWFFDGRALNDIGRAEQTQEKREVFGGILAFHAVKKPIQTHP
jgi:hypothetical protein